MTRLGWVAGVVVLAFWMAGLMSFFLGGLALVGHIVQAFLVVVGGWVARKLYREYYETLKNEYDREQIYQEWRAKSRRKGMD